MHLNKNKENIINDWYGTNKFKNIVGKIVKSHGYDETNLNYDDFISIANEVFVDSIYKWSEKGNFDGFFLSNLKKKYATKLRDLNRLKNGGSGGNYKSKYDDESDPTMELRFREKMKHDGLKLSLISMDDDCVENDVSIAEKVTKDVINVDESLDGRFSILFKNLRKREKKIIFMRLHNESELDIQQKMNLDHITYCRLCDSIRCKAKKVNIRLDFTNIEVEK